MKHLKQATVCALSALLLSTSMAGVAAAADVDTYETNVADTILPRHGAPVSVLLDGARILDGEAQISAIHLAEAIQYRNTDILKG